MVFIVSDGVHDNLDPESLGLTPKDLGVNAEKLKLSSVDLLKPQKDDDDLQSVTETDPSEESGPKKEKTVASDAAKPTAELTEAHRANLNAASVLLKTVTLHAPPSASSAPPTNPPPTPPSVTAAHDTPNIAPAPTSDDTDKGRLCFSSHFSMSGFYLPSRMGAISLFD